MRSDSGRSSQSSVSSTHSCWLCISIDRVVEDMLAHPELPPGLIERCLDVLKEIMPSERDLIRVIVEIVVELRESEEEEEVEAEDVCLHPGYKYRLLMLIPRTVGSPYHFGGVQKLSSVRFSNETFRTLPRKGAVWTRL